MDIKLRNSKNKIIKYLIAAYIAGAAIRFVLAIFTCQNPFIMPDEALYANIARSIAHGTGISLRNQPITYTNVLYSFLIAPIYMVFKAGTQFRIIQLFNCLVMNLAIFPAYAIAKKFTDNKKAFMIALISLILPDMIMTTHIMTEAIVYPLFLCTIYLMFSYFSCSKRRWQKAALTSFSVFLLSQAKSGSIALALVFLGLLIFDCIRNRDRDTIIYAIVFAGVYACLALITHLALSWAGMDFAQQTLYETQTQMPTIDHLKKTLPGLLLYAFFVPISFGIFPLLIPACNLKLYDTQQKKQIILTVLALVLYAAGACYFCFDTETIGNFFNGRIHIRYVFMFLPVLLSLMYSKPLDKAKPNGWLLLYLGFMLAMTITVSFDAHLSGRRYPVDALSLSYITHDDPVLNWGSLSQIAAVTFTLGMLVLLYKRGFVKIVKRVLIICLVLGLLVANLLSYDLNNYNSSKALTDDIKQCAKQITNETALFVPDTDIYFDNTLSVLDIAMTNAPYFMKYDDLCAGLGDYGSYDSQIPPKYWTEYPTNPIPKATKFVFTPNAFYRMVLADDAKSSFTHNGYYGVVGLSQTNRLFHSALAGVTYAGEPTQNTVLYIYDEAILSRETIRVYFKVHTTSAATIVLSTDNEQFYFDLDKNSDWIYADFSIPNGSTVMKVYIEVTDGTPLIETYSLE